MSWSRYRLRDVTQRVDKVDPRSLGRDTFRYVDIGSVDGQRHAIAETEEVPVGNAPTRARQLIAEGDTVFSTVRPYLKKIGYVDQSLAGQIASTGFCVLRPSPVLFPKFLFHFSTSHRLLDQVLPLQRGASYPAVRDRDVLAATIDVPPLVEQRRIVDILENHLSRLEAARNSVATALARIDSLVAAAGLQELLPGGAEKLAATDPARLGADEPPEIRLPSGWTWMRWAEIGTSQNGRPFPSAQYRSEGARLLRPGNLGRDGRVHWPPHATRYLPDAYLASTASAVLRPGDIVMNLTAQSLKDDFLGRACIISVEDIALLNQRIARLTPVQVEPQYALAVFRSRLFRHYMKSLNTGSLIQHMFTKQVNRFWMPVPPLPERGHIVGRLSDLEERIERAQSAASAAVDREASLRRAILSAAFSGQLTGAASDSDRIEGLAAAL